MLKRWFYIKTTSQIKNLPPKSLIVHPNSRMLAKKKSMFELIPTYYKTILAGSILFTSFAEAESSITRVVDSTSNDAFTIGTLPYWLLNANNGDTIDCSLISEQSIVLTSSLPAITNSYTINGAGITINGDNNYQAFQVASGTVTINNINIQSALSKGGDGGNGYSGGGGAVGGGGAIYVHGGASVTLETCSLLNNIAQGGNGGSANTDGNAGGGGGGGFGGGNGGSCLLTALTGGGGGGHSNGGNGGSDSSIDGGNGVYFGGGGGGGGGVNLPGSGGDGGNATPTGMFTGGSKSNGNGGGGAGDSEDGFSATGSGSSGMPGNGGNGIGADFLFGSGGGGGAAVESESSGGTGVGAAGGGGSGIFSGGVGGILGGGGGGGGFAGVGGEGGFGSGGGGATTGGTGGGGFGAGGGNGGSDLNGNGGGGGGSGLGGAIFIQSQGSLVIVDAVQISNNTALAGLGGGSTGATDPGYIPAGDGVALGYDIFMRQEGSITFNLTNTLTIATPIEGDQTDGPDGSGGLYKIGKGTLNLNGANTYSGMTTISEGTLNLNGSIIGSATVNIDGTLSGNATVSGNLTNSGSLSPGNSIGTINTTNLVLTPSSFLEMEVASNGTNDLISSTGVAQINGTLEVIPLTGIYEAAQSYTIITAEGGTTGIFSKVESSVLSLLEVSYDPTAITVEVLPINALKLSGNASAAASCYLGEGFATGSDVETISSALLTLSRDEINDSFNQMQPSQFSGLAWTQIENALLIRSSYSQHLEEVNLTSPPCNGLHAWGEMIGAWQKQNSDGQQFGYTDWSGGITVGVDAVCQSDVRFGIAGSYTYSRLNWSKSAGHANVNSYYGGFYMNWLNKRGYINATLLGAYTHYQTHRHLHFASINRHAQSSHHGWEGLAGVEGGLNFTCSKHTEIVPFVRADYVYLSTQGFVENGANSLNLHVDGNQNQIIQSEIGVNWIGRYAYKNSSTSGTFVPRIKLSYINDAPLNSRHLHASFVDSDCHFTVQGLSFRQNLGAVSLGLTHLNSNNTVGTTLRYDGQFGSSYYNQEVNIALDVKF
jgi:uncharacterized protein with beta-barrel porin domain